MSKKEWSDDMGEISGFGGGYEAVCRAMVLAGIEWIDQHPEANPNFKVMRDVFGIANPDGDAAEELEKAMMGAPVFLDGKQIQESAGDDCTGAMHHAAVRHVLAYKRLGWGEYCRKLRERKQDE